MEMPQKVPLQIHIDDRGTLLQFFDLKNNHVIFAGKDKEFPIVKRIYVVNNFSTKTIRGMHYHEREWKYFIVIKGAAKFVVSKTPAPSSETFTFVLSEYKPEVLVVPPGYYNGWVALEKDTILVGMSNFTLEESLGDDKRISPESFKEFLKVKDR